MTDEQRYRCPRSEEPGEHLLTFCYPVHIPEDPIAAGDRATWDVDFEGGPSVDEAWCPTCSTRVVQVPVCSCGSVDFIEGTYNGGMAFRECRACGEVA